MKRIAFAILRRGAVEGAVYSSAVVIGAELFELPVKVDRIPEERVGGELPIKWQLASGRDLDRVVSGDIQRSRWWRRAYCSDSRIIKPRRGSSSSATRRVDDANRRIHAYGLE